MSVRLTHRLSQRERLLAILDSDLVFALADAIPEANRCSGGRPRTFPTWFLFFFAAAIDIVGSALSVQVQLQDPECWKELRNEVAARWPRNPELWLPEVPPTRDYYRRARNRLVDDPETFELVMDRYRVEAAEIAKSLGLVSTARRVQWSTIDRRDVLVGDGTVLRPMYSSTSPTRKGRNGASQAVRWDPEAALFTTGGGRVVRGNEFVLVSVRANTPNSRVILDFAHVPSPGLEVGTFLACIDRIRPLIPGADAVVYDTAVRGVHVDYLMRKHGLLVIAPVAAASVNPTTGVRTEKSTMLDIVEHDVAGRLCPHPLYGVGGRLHIGDVDDTGEVELVDGAELLRIERRSPTTPDGPYRFYGVYRIHCPHGPFEIRVPAWQTPDDDDRGINRPENLRLIAPGTAAYDRLYGFRQDAESGNRHLKRRLPDGRARDLGADRQMLGLLGHAIAVATTAQALAGRIRALPAAA